MPVANGTSCDYSRAVRKRTRILVIGHSAVRQAEDEAHKVWSAITESLPPRQSHVRCLPSMDIDAVCREIIGFRPAVVHFVAYGDLLVEKTSVNTDHHGDDGSHRELVTASAAVPRQLLQDLAAILARAVHDAERARTIAKLAGYPPEHLPECKTAAAFWNDVVEDAACGRIVLTSLINEAVKQFPHNAALLRCCGEIGAALASANEKTSGGRAEQSRRTPLEERSRGTMQPIRELLATEGCVGLVVFSANHSADLARALAPVAGVSVGMAGAWNASDRVHFTRAFYRTLGLGLSMEDAFDHGRISLALGNPEKINHPRLYGEDQGRRTCLYERDGRPSRASRGLVLGAVLGGMVGGFATGVVTSADSPNTGLSEESFRCRLSYEQFERELAKGLFAPCNAGTTLSDVVRDCKEIVAYEAQ